MRFSIDFHGSYECSEEAVSFTDAIDKISRAQLLLFTRLSSQAVHNNIDYCRRMSVVN